MYRSYGDPPETCCAPAHLGPWPYPIKGEWGLLKAASEAIAVAQPRTRTQIEDFLANVRQAINTETPSNASMDAILAYTDNAPLIEGAGPSGIPDPRIIGPAFGRAKALAEAHNANATAGAVGEAAKWYWKNMEAPLVAPSGGSSHTTDLPSHYEKPALAVRFMGKGKPIYKRPVVWVGVGIGALLTLMLTRRR